PLERPGEGGQAVGPALCEELQDADARAARREGLPRSGDARAGILHDAQASGGAGSPGVLPRREPLDPEAAELASLARRGVCLAGEAHRQGPGRHVGPGRSSAGIRTTVRYTQMMRIPAAEPGTVADASPLKFLSMAREYPQRHRGGRHATLPVPR